MRRLFGGLVVAVLAAAAPALAAPMENGTIVYDRADGSFGYAGPPPPCEYGSGLTGRRVGDFSADGSKFTFAHKGHVFVEDASCAHAVELAEEGSTDASPSLSPDGRRVAFDRYTPASWMTTPVYKLMLANSDGSNVRDVRSSRAGFSADWSPGGGRLAYVALYEYESKRIVVRDLATGEERTIGRPLDDDGPAGRHEYAPAWSPDGEWIAFTRSAYSRAEDRQVTDIWVAAADGSGMQRRVIDLEVSVSAAEWSPDGTKIAFLAANGTANGADLFVANADGTGVALVAEDAHAGQIAWQPVRPTPAPPPPPPPPPAAAGACTVMGSSGSDRLRGTPGDDVICGLGGNDTIFWSAGSDVLDGGAGRDAVSFAAAPARAVAYVSSHALVAGERTSLSGLEGVVGTRFGDVIRGSAGANRLYGGRGNDDLGGGKGRDVLYGGRGSDVLRGGPGRDACVDSAGRNVRLGCEA